MSAVRYDLAMHSLCGGKLFGINDETYEGIVWNDEGAMPTREELEAEWAKILAEGVMADRMFAYPTIDELIVAMWEKLVETDGLTSDDIADIQTRRLAVKSEFPK